MLQVVVRLWLTLRLPGARHSSGYCLRGHSGANGLLVRVRVRVRVRFRLRVGTTFLVSI